MLAHIRELHCSSRATQFYPSPFSTGHLRTLFGYLVLLLIKGGSLHIQPEAW